MTLIEREQADWVARARALAPRFGERAAAADESDAFVNEDYRELVEAKLFSAGVPAELGGGGATHEQLCEVMFEIARHSGSTALALAMHTHLIATAAWRWRHEKAPVDGLLRRVASEELILVTSGGSDWLASSGRLEKVDGGWSFSGRKIFSSGCPMGRMILTSAVWEDPANGPMVLHFAVPLDAPGVRRLDTWRVLGMRGTGSHDVTFENVFVPDAAIGVRRPKGAWHPLLHVVVMAALPIIYSVYAGLAESARDIAVREAERRAHLPDTWLLVGEVETELRAVRMARRRLIELGSSDAPGEATTNEVAIARTLLARHALRVAEIALEAAGGASFYRGAGLERVFRDLQAGRYHPMPTKAQARYSGRIALGLPGGE